jgi:serine hydrolase
MKKQMLFIHSGGAQGPHQGSDDLVACLKAGLNDRYELIYPKMPDPEFPDYEQWKETVKEELKAMKHKVILIGHSLGGSVLLKYLSEESCEKSIAGLFLIAPPYWGKRNWQADEYVLRKDFYTTLPTIARIFLYHSRNDKVVPLSHLEHYVKKIPHATCRVLKARGHLFSAGLPELVKDIMNLSLSSR